VSCPTRSAHDQGVLAAADGVPGPTCAGVGPANAWVNQARVAGEKRPSTPRPAGRGGRGVLGSHLGLSLPPPTDAPQRGGAVGGRHTAGRARRARARHGPLRVHDPRPARALDAPALAARLTAAGAARSWRCRATGRAVASSSRPTPAGRAPRRRRGLRRPRRPARSWRSARAVPSAGAGSATSGSACRTPCGAGRRPSPPPGCCPSPRGRGTTGCSAGPPGAGWRFEALVGPAFDETRPRVPCALAALPCSAGRRQHGPVDVRVLAAPDRTGTRSPSRSACGRSAAATSTRPTSPAGSISRSTAARRRVGPAGARGCDPARAAFVEVDGGAVVGASPGALPRPARRTSSPRHQGHPPGRHGGRGRRAALARSRTPPRTS
jgi:hypothetical protein